MSMQRYVFPIAYDTGDGVTAKGDTGKVPIHGEIRQVRWAPEGAGGGDTGGDLYIALLPKMGDTGDGFAIFERADCLGANFTRMPSVQTSHFDNFDTGSTTEMPFVAAGERLRIKVTPGRDVGEGRLYVYVKS